MTSLQRGWSLHATPWRRLKEIGSGLEWKRVYLLPELKAQLPESSGVYVICASPRMIPISGPLSQKIYAPVYVGQASNLRARFMQHVSGYGGVRDAKILFRRLDFWWAEVPLSGLDDFEQALIDAFGPAANAKNVKVRIGEPVPAGKRIKETTK